MRHALVACAALGAWGGVSTVAATAADFAEPVDADLVQPDGVVQISPGGGRRLSLAEARARADREAFATMYGFDEDEAQGIGSIGFDVVRVADALGMEVDRSDAALLGRVVLHVVDDSRTGSHPIVTSADDSYVRRLDRSRPDAPVSVYDVGAGPQRMLPQRRGLRVDYAQAVSAALPGAIEVAVEPRANVVVDGDVSSVGGGAIVRFGRNLSDPREDQQGWYAFVGADAQALTWSFGGGREQERELRLEDKQLIGDYQVGVARRLGEGDLSFGYIHREVKYNGASRNEQFVGVAYAVRR